MENINDNTSLKVNDYLYALQQKNLVYNHDFRYFSNQIKNGDTTEYGIPDGWIYKDPGSNGSINFDEESRQCTIMKSSDNSLMYFSQALHEFPRWNQMLLGKIITAKVTINISTYGKLDVTLSDGINSNTITKNQKGDFEIIVQLKIDSLAESVSLSVASSEPFMNIKITSICANVGEVTLENLPCIVQGVIGERKQYIATETAPAEELSLCEAPIELNNNYTRLNSVINGRFGLGANGNSNLLDMRGYFSRAWNNGSETDTDSNNRTKPGTGQVNGDHVSTFEEDVFLKHDHGLNFSINKALATGDKGAATKIVTTNPSKTDIEADGKETRPKNIAELYTIKWA